jgi:hypothetical protein
MRTSLAKVINAELKADAPAACRSRPFERKDILNSAAAAARLAATAASLATAGTADLGGRCGRAREAGRPGTWANVCLPVGGVVLGGPLLVEEVAKSSAHEIRRLLREEVAGKQLAAADVGSVLPPDADRVGAGTDRA